MFSFGSKNNSLKRINRPPPPIKINVFKYLQQILEKKCFPEHGIIFHI